MTGRSGSSKVTRLPCPDGPLSDIVCLLDFLSNIGGSSTGVGDVGTVSTEVFVRPSRIRDFFLVGLLDISNVGAVVTISGAVLILLAVPWLPPQWWDSRGGGAGIGGTSARVSACCACCRALEDNWESDAWRNLSIEKRRVLGFASWMGGDMGLIALSAAASFLSSAGTVASTGERRSEVDGFLAICSLDLDSRVVGSTGSEGGK